MKKKLLCALLSVAMVATLLAGCGAKEETEAPAEAPAETETEAPAAPEASGDTLVYWSMWEAAEPQGQAIAQAVEAFTAETGIAVDVQFKGRTGIREGLQPALDAGTNIDMFDEDIDRVNSTWGDYIMDLEELAKAADYEATANAGLIGACREVGGGTLKSIPYQPNVFAFFYNEAIFEEAGVTKVPATWAELLDACEKIKAAGYTPITSDDAYICSNFGYHMSRLVGEATTTAIVQNGLWDHPAVAATAKAYEELASKGYLSETIEGNVWPAGQNTELALGTAAMYLNGSWLPNEVKDTAGPDFKWGCFSYPALDAITADPITLDDGTEIAPAATGVEASNYGAQVFAINKNSQKAEQAFQLIQFITKGEYDKVLSDMSVGIPADSTNAEWPELLKNVKPVMDSLTTRFTWGAGAEANADMTPIIKENFLKLCGGSITADEFVANLAAAGK